MTKITSYDRPSVSSTVRNSAQSGSTFSTSLKTGITTDRSGIGCSLSGSCTSAHRDRHVPTLIESTYWCSFATAERSARYVNLGYEGSSTFSVRVMTRPDSPVTSNS